ncbi:MAG: hypothetical protein HY701_06960 [Gemmatimonadetes bacterium]|nr:hypothetical protein [Gemmatimonadota bacterium]
MREFVDQEGRRWRATAQERPGPDFKGKWYLVFESLDEAGEGPAELRDVCWNSRKTAERTLATMGEIELQRRLGSALGRRQRPVPAP